ncbi:glucosamine-6-phosphate deaminase [Portibacter lacus]|uniref:Glucosamine-6-phosphate deaminase n=1 Tax=Portibacter lacus TaxID=1099794 RepID=A0AA37SMN6_9BACT|nr:glucosamine-6-phosphate deaminase [Portibacter lacus]GLR15849.1 glucosamine-6-phosphate deaminase [Portibacter lacus]
MKVNERMMKRNENIPTRIFDNADKASCQVALEIAELIREKQSKGENCVLGLATGSTPVNVYKELVRLHKEDGLSFKNVITFNLDEYFPIEPKELQSYVRFMHEYLFDHIDIPSDQINIPDGTLAKEEVYDFCQAYEEKIETSGGLDLQILGIGRTGHIGFNEPGSGEVSETRLITLDHMTVMDAASDFFGEENVPTKAITMGVGTIMKADRIILMAWGEGKAGIIKKALEGPVSDQIPATYLQKHPNAEFILDEGSSAELTRIKTPWLVSFRDWNDEVEIKRAVCWLGQKLKKPILKLTNRDYADNGMADLITTYDTAYNINIKIFNALQNTITGWPGGKPDADDTRRPERREPARKRVILFSPHPDDDVISMGGTFSRLAEQGHDVHVAYQTSGNIAVFDDDVVRFADFVNDFHTFFDMPQQDVQQLFDGVREDIENKKPGIPDSDRVKKIKGLIRRGEAKAGARYVGIPDEKMHFLDMPFYETGTVKKKDLSQEDIDIIKKLFREIEPHQVFAAGDLSDPHGTHRTCLNAILGAVEQCKEEPCLSDMYLWLYRGAWQEWDVQDIDMAVPLSPDELLKKRRAIFKHQSQKDRAMFPGNDAREFWQRSEDRNKNTARVYDELGLPEYEAIEAFKRYYY